MRYFVPTFGLVKVVKLNIIKEEEEKKPSACLQHLFFHYIVLKSSNSAWSFVLWIHFYFQSLAHPLRLSYVNKCESTGGCGAGVCWYMLCLVILLSLSSSTDSAPAFLNHFPVLSSTTSSIILLLPSSIHHPHYQSLPHSIMYSFLPASTTLFSLVYCLAESLYWCLHNFPLHLSNGQPPPTLPLKMSTVSTLHLFMCMPQSCRYLFS